MKQAVIRKQLGEMKTTVKDYNRLTCTMEDVPVKITFVSVEFTTGSYAGHLYIERTRYFGASGVIDQAAQSNVLNMPLHWREELPLCGVNINTLTPALGAAA